jgi:hypothetical protein
MAGHPFRSVEFRWRRSLLRATRAWQIGAQALPHVSANIRIAYRVGRSDPRGATLILTMTERAIMARAATRSDSLVRIRGAIMVKLSAALISASVLVSVVLVLTDAQGQTSTTPGQSAQQGQSDTSPKALVAARTAKVTGTVEEIDYPTRTAVLRGEGGREVAIKAPEEARNFDQVKKGDKVVVEYVEAVALSLRKPGADAGSGSSTASGSSSAGRAEQSGVRQFETVELAPKGQTPRGLKTRVTQITEERKVTLRGPQGGVSTVDVSDDVKDLENVKKGDEVVIEHTEAVLMAVEK